MPTVFLQDTHPRRPVCRDWPVHVRARIANRRDIGIRCYTVEVIPFQIQVAQMVIK
jgi:hypothetical protein